MSKDNYLQDRGMPPAKRQKTDDTETAQPIETKSPRHDETTNKISDEDDKYTDFMNPEEIEKLREFRVLDEVKSNDEDSNDCDDSDSSSGESVDLPDEEIEKMLEEDLPDDFKAAPKPKEKVYIKREKIILEEKGVNLFEVLPLDWIMIRHQSGMPVYVHRTSRVCTLSKPYFLGKGNAKRHDIPISAIPCLAYRRALEEEEKQKLIDKKVEEQIKLGTWNFNTKENNDKSNSDKDDQRDQVVVNITPPDSNLTSHSGHVSVGIENTANNSKAFPNGTINVESQQRKCPFKHSSVSSSQKTSCPVRDISGANINPDETEQGNSSKVVVSDKDTEQTNRNGNDTSENTSETKDDDVNDVKSNESTVDDVEIPSNRQPIVLPGGVVMPSPRVETVNTSWKTKHLTHDQVNEYCKKLFKFRVLSIMHFKRWADRRKYTKARKALQHPMLPEGTKLITIPVQSVAADGTGKGTKRDWVMNMNGRSSLSVFHEYVRRVLHKQPVYEFKQLENASTPYQATVYIGSMQYGVGHGSSKRQAKSAAACASIHILIPELRDFEPKKEGDPDFSFFDYMSIEDPRVTEFCAATCEPTPHAILRTCLLRNFGASDRQIHIEVKKLEYQKIELTMKVGKHSATVVCKNKKTAKQRASQAILQALHPHVRSWGSLIRLYGSRSVKSCKEKKLEEQQITLLQDKARHNEPNYAVLDKLRNEMHKLRERDRSVLPVGPLLLAGDLPTHSGSNLNNVDL